MSPDRGHDMPTSTPLHPSHYAPHRPPPLPPQRSSSLLHSPRNPTTMPPALGPMDPTSMPMADIQQLAAIVGQLPNHTSTSFPEDVRPCSLHSTTTEESGPAKQDRRDSGYSSSKSGRRPKRGSRSSSKQSEPSTRATSVSDEGSSRLANRPRLVSVSTVQNPPKLNMDEAIALHERSRLLFPSPSQSPIASKPTEQLHVLHRSMSTPQGLSLDSRPPTRSKVMRTQTYNTLPRRSGLRGLSDLDLGKQPEEEPEPPAVPSTVMHWTSDETRRKEYAQIDKSNRGIRGVLNKLFGRNSTRSKFYDDKHSDAGSVRRIRLDLDEER